MFVAVLTVFMKQFSKILYVVKFMFTNGYDVCVIMSNMLFPLLRQHQFSLGTIGKFIT